MICVDGGSGHGGGVQREMVASSMRSSSLQLRRSIPSSLRVVGVDDQRRWLVRVRRRHNDSGNDKHLGDGGICQCEIRIWAKALR